MLFDATEAARDLAQILNGGRARADARSVRRVLMSDLPAGDQDQLLRLTLGHLSAQPSSASPMTGWRMVSARAAGVMTYWAETLGIVEDEEARKRFRTLRQEVYDLLEDRLQLVKEPGQGKPVHLPPQAQHRQGPSALVAEADGAGFGSAELNRLVEAAAVQHVTAVYKPGSTAAA